MVHLCFFYFFLILYFFFKEYAETDQTKNNPGSGVFDFKPPNEEEASKKSDGFFADFNYQTNFNKDHSQTKVPAKLSSKQSLSKEGGDEVYFEDFNKFNFDIGNILKNLSISFSFLYYQIFINLFIH